MHRTRKPAFLAERGLFAWIEAAYAPTRPSPHQARAPRGPRALPWEHPGARVLWASGARALTRPGDLGHAEHRATVRVIRGER